MTVTSLPARTAAALFAGFGIVGALAGCAATGAPAGESTAGTPATGSPTPQAGAAAGAYTDGSYQAEGEYVSPGGRESIGVSMTLADGIVTQVTVTPRATAGNAAQYQGQFASGIAGEVVGKSLDELKVSRVAGSSLTSGGFNQAVEAIKADAGAS